MHRQPYGFAERQAVRRAQRDVDGEPLGEVHLDRHPQREEARRKDDLAHVGDRHPRWRVDVEADTDRHRQVVAQGER
nr:hypothetical protein CPGR_02170 [Mycolicibacterium komanii]